MAWIRVLSLDLSYVSILVVVRGCLDNIFARLCTYLDISGVISTFEDDLFDAKHPPQLFLLSYARVVRSFFFCA